CKVAQYEMGFKKPNQISAVAGELLDLTREEEDIVVAPDANLSKKKKRNSEMDEREHIDEANRKRTLLDEKMEIAEEPVKKLSKRARKKLNREIRANERKPEADASLWVYNLSSRTTNMSLSQFFQEHFNFRNAKVERVFDRRHPHTKILMGFVQFWTKDDAERAFETMQGAQLDGHSIELTKQKMKKDPAEKRILIVKRIPLKRSFSDIDYLITSFGGFKRLHMARNDDGSHRR
ncbi:hypothetical protein PMAYCL1PPCAC_14593, partial [Pristionchus mayeri]